MTMVSSRTSTTGPVAWYVLLAAHARDDTNSTAVKMTIGFIAVLLRGLESSAPRDHQWRHALWCTLPAPGDRGSVVAHGTACGRSPSVHKTVGPTPGHQSPPPGSADRAS